MSAIIRRQAPNSAVLYSRNRPGFAQLHPTIEPYDAGWLEVGEGHRVYWEAGGNPRGEAALLLHGGPGGAIMPRDRRFFDPGRYRIIAFDQRGCGRSTPAAELRANTTAYLIGDMERLRVHLGVERWLLFGGSWGATLALAYAQAHTGRVSRLVLRGVFLACSRELRWLYQGGAAQFHPEAWQRFVGRLPQQGRRDVAGAYAAALAGPMTEDTVALARAWCHWEDSLMAGPDSMASEESAGDIGTWATARIGAHYLAHGAFLQEGALLAGADRLGGLPGAIVQGRYDLVTPMASAWALHKAWPGSVLRVVEGAGHASDEPGVACALLESVQAPSSVSMSGT